jgi:Xaa-Pro dipeptidase
MTSSTLRRLSGAAVFLLASLSPAWTAAQGPSKDVRTREIERLAAELKQGDPWPAIRRERIEKLLPVAMAAAKVDAWVIFCRENHSDPLARHVGGEHAGRLTTFVFTRVPGGVESHAIASPTEVITLGERLTHAKVVAGAAGQSAFELVAAYLREKSPAAIAINKSELTVADGLTATQHQQLIAALGPDLARRLTSSEELVHRWLGVKLPAEIEIMRKAGTLTSLLEYEAFETVVPGKTTNLDLQRYLRRRVEELELGHAWEDNPGIQSGLDRGRGSDAKRVIIPGDIIDIDFGIKVHDIWCTDVQRFAYVLGPGETSPPPQIRKAWEGARESSRRMVAAMRPGVAGWEVDRVQVEWMESQGSLRHWAGTGHSVGYWAHDVGPSIGGYSKDGPPRGAGARTLEPGMVFAFDGNFVWAAEDAGQKGTRSITLEEMAAVTANGAEYLTPVQEELVLIKTADSKR